jgi:hypothetical protein
MTVDERSGSRKQTQTLQRPRPDGMDLSQSCRESQPETACQSRSPLRKAVKASQRAQHRPANMLLKANTARAGVSCRQARSAFAPVRSVRAPLTVRAQKQDAAETQAFEVSSRH